MTNAVASEVDTIDAVVQENVALHNRIEFQRIALAAANAEVLRQHEMNISLRRIVAYIILQNAGSYRVLARTVLDNEQYRGNIGMKIDPITSDWIFTLEDERVS